jgi:hypothetical protein
MTRGQLLFFNIVAITALSIGGVTIAKANCSSKVIRALNDGGKGVSAIAKICDMSREDVLDALKGDGDSDDSTTDNSNSDVCRPRSPIQRGFPSGTPISGCGCWGPVSPGASLSNPNCASGIEHAQQCLGFCQAGGSPWARVCN